MSLCMDGFVCVCVNECDAPICVGIHICVWQWWEVCGTGPLSWDQFWKSQAAAGWGIHTPSQSPACFSADITGGWAALDSGGLFSWLDNNHVSDLKFSLAGEHTSQAQPAVDSFLKELCTYMAPQSVQSPTTGASSHLPTIPPGFARLAHPLHIYISSVQ